MAEKKVRNQKPESEKPESEKPETKVRNQSEKVKAKWKVSALAWCCLVPELASTVLGLRAREMRLVLLKISNKTNQPPGAVLYLQLLNYFGGKSIWLRAVKLGSV